MLVLLFYQYSIKSLLLILPYSNGVVILFFQGTSGKVYDLLPEEDETEELNVAPVIQPKTSDVTNENVSSTKSRMKKKKKKKSSESKKKKKRKRNVSTSSSNVSLK